MNSANLFCCGQLVCGHNSPFPGHTHSSFKGRRRRRQCPEGRARLLCNERRGLTPPKGARRPSSIREPLGCAKRDPLSIPGASGYVPRPLSSTLCRAFFRGANRLKRHERYLHVFPHDCPAMERMRGIEPPSSAWKADVLAVVRHPRMYTRPLSDEGRELV